MLTTLARYKTYYGITDSTNDAKITMVLGMVSAEIESFCGRIFGQADYTKTCKGTDTEYIALEQYPVIGDVTITEDGEAFTDFTALPEYGMLEHDLSTWSSAKEYVISYAAGYVLPEDATEENPQILPEDLENVCMIMASMEIERQGSEHLKSETIGPLRSEYLQDMPIYLKRRLEAHSKKVI